MKKIKLFLDDVRPAPDGYQLVKTVNELQRKVIQYEHINEVSLDNDLGTNHLEGYDFVKWFIQQKIENKPYTINIFHIHSANPIAVTNMRSLLSNAIKCGLIKSIIK